MMMDYLNFCIQNTKRALFGSTIIIIMIVGNSFGQSCPSFKIKSIKDVKVAETSGEVTVKIKSSKLYSVENFEVMQTNGVVKGPLGYDIQKQISTDEIVIRGLKRSKEMYFDEYVIFFADKGCENNKLIKVGTFKIK